MMSQPTRDSVVTLREITADTVRAICSLSVHPTQTRFVAPNAVSIAEAHFSSHAWFRAIYASSTPVGFVMVETRPDMPVYLWRFMIDVRYQGLGFGRRALDQVLVHVRKNLGASFLETSVVQDDGGPQGFYERAGFVLTGGYEEGEAVMRLEL
jgi:diamine N-acetyltransferase